jgi:hypothetical protein
MQFRGIFSGHENERGYKMTGEYFIPAIFHGDIHYAKE